MLLATVTLTAAVTASVAMAATLIAAVATAAVAAVVRMGKGMVCRAAFAIASGAVGGGGVV